MGLSYLGLLFWLAYRSEQPSSNAFNRFLNNRSGLLYALSLGVYCTAWTFYGSVGRAAESGLDFLAIFIGPTIMAPLWWILVRKMVRITKQHGVSTLPDLISARYGKHQGLGRLVAVVLLLGVIPYISLQIKAISESFSFVVKSNTPSAWYSDPGMYITLAMMVFVIAFGARYVQTNRPKKGIVTVVAFESVFKLATILIAGVYVCFVLFPSPLALFSEAQLLPQFSELSFLENGSKRSDWFWLILISSLAVVLLPRQFQMGVAENQNEQHLKKAMWIFPLYLLLINVFVLPIALAGLITFNGDQPSEYYLLALSAKNGAILQTFVFLGGFSAATAMIIVSALALGQIMSNNILLPMSINTMGKSQLEGHIILLRRVSIIVVLLLAYLYYITLAQNESLIHIGIISFVAVSQLAPAVIIGLYWKKASLNGAFAGILTGSIVWFITLILPLIIEASGISIQWWINPENVFALEGISPISNSIMLSLTANLVAFTGFSIHSKQDVEELNQSELFVDVFKYSREYENTLYASSTTFPNIKSLLIKFLGDKRTEEVLDRYARINQIDWKTNPRVDSRVISYAERLLTEAIGPASARIMIASVVQEEDISINEVVNILKESQEVINLNKRLKTQSQELRAITAELQNANDELKRVSGIKDDFLYTVTHELRTPLTSIRTQSEILLDMNDALNENERQQFLQTIVRDCERLTRLITDVLDLEKFESGNQQLNISSIHLPKLIGEVVESMENMLHAKNITFDLNIARNIPKTTADRDRIIQVITNLLSNAIKFCHPEKGYIRISCYTVDDRIKMNVIDNGNGISKDQVDRIFDKFYQAQNQLFKKPTGTGLGLAICKNIVELHNGNIYVTPEKDGGTRFSCEIPIIKS